jgi:precorrin-4/cobalt-precorrin-4 C11-methyltransferase
VGGAQAVTVHFIGAGPGAPDLITLRAQRLIASCPVCLYAGALVPPEVLAHAPDQARLIDTQHLALDGIIAELQKADEQGHDVARLCSGDPSVYSAIAEQARRLDELSIDWDITPGVPAFAAAAATLKRELTVPEVAQTVILARYGKRASKIPERESLASLAEHRATLAIHLGAQAIGEIVGTLTPAYGASAPVAVVAYASRADEVVLRGTLATIADQVSEAGIKRTAIILVGPALAAAGFRDSHLYSKVRLRDGG